MVIHNWEEARQLADRTGVIRQGRLEAKVNPYELEKIAPADTMPGPDRFDGPYPPAHFFTAGNGPSWDPDIR